MRAPWPPKRIFVMEEPIALTLQTPSLSQPVDDVNSGDQSPKDDAFVLTQCPMMIRPSIHGLRSGPDSIKKETVVQMVR